MRKPLLLVSTVLVSGLLLVSPVHAQQAMPPAADARADVARMEVRFSALEERLREMQGKIEQVEYENRRLREQLDQFQQDTNIRFDGLQGSATAATGNSETVPAVMPEKNEKSPATAGAGEKQVLKVPSKDATSFADSREHYNHAFRLLNQTQYDEAGASFESFIKAYPKDPLIGNAYYWAGETYYVRQNYVQAADYFRQGYEALPEGPKAGDNLLKLAMSLSALNRNTESCVVLKQVAAKFGQNSSTLKKKAEMERNRIGCK